MRDRPATAFASVRSSLPFDPSKPFPPSKGVFTEPPLSAESNDPNKVTVADLTTGLIREYLVSKGLRKTLEVLGTEELLVSSFDVDSRLVKKRVLQVALNWFSFWVSVKSFNKIENQVN